MEGDKGGREGGRERGKGEREEGSKGGIETNPFQSSLIHKAHNLKIHAKTENTM